MLLELRPVIVTIAQLPHDGGFTGICMNRGNGLEPVPFIQQIDRGPVTELWDNDFQQAIERRLQIQRFCERFAGLSQEG